MSVAEFPLNEQRLADAVQTLNRMGPETVREEAFKRIQARQASGVADPNPKSQSDPKLYLIVDNTSRRGP